MSGSTLNTQSVPSNKLVRVTAQYSEGGVTYGLYRNVTILNVDKILQYVVISGDELIPENSSAIYTVRAYFDDGSSEIVSGSWSGGSANSNMSASGTLSTGEVSSTEAASISMNYCYNGVCKSDSLTVWIYNSN